MPFVHIALLAIVLGSMQKIIIVIFIPIMVIEGIRRIATSKGISKCSLHGVVCILDAIVVAIILLNGNV